jgi:hypothetical protein
MSMPVLAPAQIAQLSELVAQYICGVRVRYAAAAKPLSQEQKRTMAAFFSHELIDQSRLLVLVGERVPNPEFYPMLAAMGFTNLPDQSAMAAITFSDVVVSHVQFSDGLLFHELVHVEQYRQLGIPRFADLYIRGFLAGGGYDQIPLERNAYQLGGEFERDRTRPFRVADAVTKWIAEGRF